jgi:Cu/Ag efflux protein CusF
MKKPAILILICSFILSACEKSASEVKNQTVKAAPTASAAQSVPATPGPSAFVPKNKTYNGRGVVTKINLELVSVEVNHEKIEGLMDAMVMEFFVAKKAELETLKVGDKVEFVIEYKDGQEKIISIGKAK